MSDFILPNWLPAGALGVVLFASFARGLVLCAKGVASYGFGFKPELQQVAERFWKAAVVLVAASALIAWLAPQWEPALGRPGWSHDTPLQWIAGLILIVGALIVVASQQSMGASWRVGVPKDGPGDLVTRELFRFSRNPVFVGMFAMTIGVFLWSPTLVSAAAVPLAAAMMAVQVQLEEEALTAKYGETYLAYAAKTPRWVWPLV